MRLFTIGTAGFMGSNFVRYEAKKIEVSKLFIYDKLTYAGRLENIADIVDNKRVIFKKADLCDEEAICNSLREFEPDYIVNFAAESHVDRSINEPSLFIRTNILCVHVLLECLRRMSSEPVLVHISTDEVYGDLRDGGFADESWPLNPSSPYSASKASGELLVRAYSRTYGMKSIVVRPCNNYGPFQHPEKLIPRTIVRLLQGRKATIYGDGNQTRDWIYVGDFVAAMDLILRKGKAGEVYNICAGEHHSIKEVVFKVAEVLGKDPKGSVEFVEGRPGEDYRYAMKCEKIASLGFRTSVSFEEGLRRTIAWYLENRGWWEKILDEYVLERTPWRKSKI